MPDEQRQHQPHARDRDEHNPDLTNSLRIDMDDFFPRRRILHQHVSFRGGRGGEEGPGHAYADVLQLGDRRGGGIKDRGVEIRNLCDIALEET